MPIPLPEKGENKDTFMERCMGDAVMQDEYTEKDQRYAVCLSQFEGEKEKKAISLNIEKRDFDFHVDNSDKSNGEHRLVGHAAVFNEYTEINWFEEKVLRGAFSKSIKNDDIRALFNHDPNYILGRYKSGRANNTLSLSEDAEGLGIDIIMPDTQFARDLTVLIQRGDISQMSFSFHTIEERWEPAKNGEKTKRDLIAVRVFDVSPVTYPCYQNTDVAVRSFRSWKESHTLTLPALSWETSLKRKRLDLNLRGGKKNE